MITFGCYYAIDKRSTNKTIRIGLFLTGITYIIVYKYLCVTPIVMTFWTGTSMIACFFIIPVAGKLIDNQN